MFSLPAHVGTPKSRAMKIHALDLLFAVLLSLGCAGPTAVRHADAQPVGDDPTIKSLLETIRRETQVPGIAVAVIDRGGVVATAAVGQRRIDEAAPLLSSDKFHLGSNTKAMTAFLMARLVDRGFLRWDMTLAEAFPEWNASMAEPYRSVRLMDILRHRAGMPAVSPLGGIDFAAPLVAQRLAFAKSVLHRAPAATPGEKFLYSNAGYRVVGVRSASTPRSKANPRPRSRAT